MQSYELLFTSKYPPFRTHFIEQINMISKMTRSPTPVGNAVPGTNPKYFGFEVSIQSTQVKFCCTRLGYVLGILLASTNSSGWSLTLTTKWIIFQNRKDIVFTPNLDLNKAAKERWSSLYLQKFPRCIAVWRRLYTSIRRPVTLWKYICLSRMRFVAKPNCRSFVILWRSINTRINMLVKFRHCPVKMKIVSNNSNISSWNNHYRPDYEI